MSDNDRDETELELEMVSQKRGFRSVMKLKRWVADRWLNTDTERNRSHQ